MDFHPGCCRSSESKAHSKFPSKGLDVMKRNARLTEKMATNCKSQAQFIEKRVRVHHELHARSITNRPTSRQAFMLHIASHRYLIKEGKRINIADGCTARTWRPLPLKHLIATGQRLKIPNNDAAGRLLLSESGVSISVHIVRAWVYVVSSGLPRATYYKDHSSRAAATFRTAREPSPAHELNKTSGATYSDIP